MSMLSKKKRDELECIMYFSPSVLKNIPVNEEDIQKYFEWSEQGKHNDEIYEYREHKKKFDGFFRLVEAKRWRGINVHELYEQGVLEGTMPYYVILGGIDDKPIPYSVVKFLEKEMFQGADAKIIENLYQWILYENKNSNAS